MTTQRKCYSEYLIIISLLFLLFCPCSTKQHWGWWAWDVKLVYFDSSSWGCGGDTYKVEDLRVADFYCDTLFFLVVFQQLGNKSSENKSNNRLKWFTSPTSATKIKGFTNISHKVFHFTSNYATVTEAILVTYMK